MSSATAVSNTVADKKVSKTKSVKKVKGDVSTDVDIAPVTSAQDDEGDVVTVEASAPMETESPSDNSDVTVTVTDSIPDSESAPKKRASRKKKDTSSDVYESITDMSQALSKLAEFEQSLKELASLISAMKAMKSETQTEVKSAKTPKGFKKDGQPRKKAEYPQLALHPDFKSYLETHDVVSALQTEDAEFGTEFSDGKLHRLEIQQAFARIIKNLRAELPEEATKSMVEKTNKKGETVIDNTYYRISGDNMKAFFKMIGDIIVSKSSSLDGEEKTKYATKVSEMTSKGYFTATVKDDKVSKVVFPDAICQQWQMAYFGFLTM
jgi:hypothetical protein